MTTAVTQKTGARPSLVKFSATVAAGWLVLATSGWALARQRHIPLTIALPPVLAFLTEYSFYLLPGFARIRRYLGERFGRGRLAAFIIGSATLPYLIFAIPLGVFRFAPALTYIALMGAVAAWFVPRVEARRLAAARDLGFLGFLAAVILSGLLRWIFPSPIPKLSMEILGHIILIRSAILAALLLGDADDAGFGFIPRPRDLAIGALWFVACAAVALPLGLIFGEVRATRHMPGVWTSIGVILGIFWVVALSEEFFFRALLQRWLIGWTRSTAAGLALASLCYGACHLQSHGKLPNWQFAALASILGFACGLAFLQARSIRASMVTHALAASALRLFLS